MRDRTSARLGSWCWLYCPMELVTTSDRGVYSFSLEGGWAEGRTATWCMAVLVSACWWSLIISSVFPYSEKDLIWKII